MSPLRRIGRWSLPASSRPGSLRGTSARIICGRLCGPECRCSSSCTGNRTARRGSRRWIAAELLELTQPSATGVPGLLAPVPAAHAVLLAAHSWAHAPLRRLLDLIDVTVAVEHDRDRALAGELAQSLGARTGMAHHDRGGRCAPAEPWVGAGARDLGPASRCRPGADGARDAPDTVGGSAVRIATHPPWSDGRRHADIRRRRSPQRRRALVRRDAPNPTGDRRRATPTV